MSRIEGHSDLVRDDRNSAVVSTDESEYRAYMERFNARKIEVERLNSLEQKVKDQDAKLDLILKLLQEK